jgi:hypothetical protein
LRHGHEVLNALIGRCDDENLEVVAVPDPGKESFREKELERADLAARCLQ